MKTWCQLSKKELEKIDYDNNKIGKCGDVFCFDCYGDMIIGW